MRPEVYPDTLGCAAGGEPAEILAPWMPRFAARLQATVLRPYYPVSDLFRVVRDDGLQVDFMATVHGLRSFAGVRARATMVALDGATIAVASLADIIRSKRAAGRPQDLAVVEVLEKTHAQARKEAPAADSTRQAGRARARKRPRAR